MLRFTVVAVAVSLALCGDAPAQPVDAITCASQPWAGIIRTIARPQQAACSQEGGIVTFTVAMDRAPPSSALAVSIAPAGRFLTRARYRTAYDAADDARRRRDFPDVGARAMVEQVSAGPGGAAFSIVSTTDDERFDMRLTAAELGSRDGRRRARPLDPFAVNRRLHELYNEAVIAHPARSLSQ